jgi:hypothetical protein
MPKRVDGIGIEEADNPIPARGGYDWSITPSSQVARWHSRDGPDGRIVHELAPKGRPFSAPSCAPCLECIASYPRQHVGGLFTAHDTNACIGPHPRKRGE